MWSNSLSVMYVHCTYIHNKYERAMRFYSVSQSNRVNRMVIQKFCKWRAKQIVLNQFS